MKEKVLLKDQLYNRKKVEKIAREITVVYPSFHPVSFTDDTLASFASLELKERMYHVRDMLAKYLPVDYKEALEILLASLPEELDSSKSDDDFGDFIYAPYAEFVTKFGCKSEDLELSLAALREITKRFSVEFAIRDFINDFPEQTLQMLQDCALSENYHERRLASESLRPKLPWAKKLTIDYKEAIFILDKLYYDPTRYVTRSVANHLNDISKIDPSLVCSTLRRWQTAGDQESKEMAYMLSHALRTLVKKGDAEALEMLGYKNSPKIIVSECRLLTEEVKIGEVLPFAFRIEAKEHCRLMVDYIIHFNTKSAKSSPKVHKIKSVTLQKNESISILKKHLFKANMTTRKLYAGEHKVELQINGKCYELGSVLLKV